jgi:hypothetical protein
MTDETSGRGVAHPSIIAVLDLHGRLSLDSTAMLKMPGRLDQKNCLKTGVHSTVGTVSQVPLATQSFLGQNESNRGDFGLVSSCQT